MSGPTSAHARHPVIELLARYGAIFRAAWARRDEMAGPRRSSDEAAFLPAALSLQDTPIHPAPRRMAFVLIALFLAALAWSILGHVDIVAVAPGRIEVSERTKTIQPLERSVVKRVLVKDGDHVQAGQPLVELDPTSANADAITIGEELKSSQSGLLRTRALEQALSSVQRSTPELSRKSVPAEWTPVDLAAANRQLAAEWDDISAKLTKFASEIARRQAEMATMQAMLAKIQSTLPLVRQREADFRKLTDQGFMSSHANQDRTRERIELEKDLATQRAHLVEAGAALRESQDQRASYLAETRRLLSQRKAESELKGHHATQEMTKAAQREKLTSLTAPVAGTVQQLAAHTEGGVVVEAQPIMVIVPQDAIVVAEVTLDNKDIGFVSAGQRAEIKLETFPYTRYGTVGATVSRVTPDAVKDEKRGAVFQVALALDRNAIDVDGKPIKLSPGMNLTAEVKTGQRRIIEFLLSPVQQATGESLRER